MRPRSGRGQAPPPADYNIFVDPAYCAAAKDLEDNWAKKYKSDRTALVEHFDKKRLGLPLGKREITDDMVAMGIWHKDDRGRLIKRRDPAKREQEESKTKAEKESPTTSKRNSPKQSTRGPRKGVFKALPIMSRADLNKYNDEGRGHFMPAIVRSRASTISLRDEVEDVVPSSASTISLQDEEDGSNGSKQKEAKPAKESNQKQAESANDYSISYDGGTKITLKRKRSVEGMLDELSEAPSLTMALLRNDLEELEGAEEGTVKEKASLLTLPAELRLFIIEACASEKA